MPREILSTTRPTPLRLWGFLLTAAGGTLAGVGALLDWAAIGFPGDARGELDVPVKGVDLWEGKIVLLAAVLALLGTVAIRLALGARSRRSITIAIVALGALGAALALSVALRSEARLGGSDGLDQLAASLSDRLGEDEAEVRTQLEERFSEQLRVDVEPGIWVAAAGGIVIVAGGALSFAWVLPGDSPASMAWGETRPDISDGSGDAVRPDGRTDEP